MRRSIVVVTGLLTVLGFIACSQDKIEEFRVTQEQKAQGYIPDPLAFDVEIAFSHAFAKKSGTPIGEGQIFGVGENAKVWAVVDVRNLEPDRVTSLHLIWLRPGDQKEVFRKYAEISLEKTDAGWRKKILWKKAEDLTHFKEEVQEGENPDVRLTSVMSVTPEKERGLGVYTFRVYYNRELLTEKTFELVAGEIRLDGPGGGPFHMGEKAAVDGKVRLTGLLPGKVYRAEMAWHKPGGRKLFGKKTKLTADADGVASLAGRLDISTKKKRAAGEYQLKVYLDASLVGREKFELTQS